MRKKLMRKTMPINVIPSPFQDVNTLNCKVGCFCTISSDACPDDTKNSYTSQQELRPESPWYKSFYESLSQGCSKQQLVRTCENCFDLPVVMRYWLLTPGWSSDLPVVTRYWLLTPACSYYLPVVMTYCLLTPGWSCDLPVVTRYWLLKPGWSFDLPVVTRYWLLTPGCSSDLPVVTRYWLLTPGWSTSCTIHANIVANISRSVKTFCTTTCHSHDYKSHTGKQIYIRYVCHTYIRMSHILAKDKVS